MWLNFLLKITTLCRCKKSTFFGIFHSDISQFLQLLVNTYRGHFLQFLKFCLSEISLGMWRNNWLLKMHPIFEGSNGNLIRCIRSAFRRYSGNVSQLWWTCYISRMWNFFRILCTKNNTNHLIFDWVIYKIKGGRFYWDTVYLRVALWPSG